MFLLDLIKVSVSVGANKNKHCLNDGTGQWSGLVGWAFITNLYRNMKETIISPIYFGHVRYIIIGWSKYQQMVDDNSIIIITM
jgi:hypothetical protein